MVVDDEALIRGLLVEFLADAGFRTLEAATAEDAVRLLQMATNVRLIITDINMPGRLDGIALAKAARAHSPTIPIVFISGRPTKLFEARVVGGPSAYLAKPFDLDRLLADVQRLVAA